MFDTPTDTLVFSFFLIFTGAALVSTLALYTRQSLLVGYILLGMLLGPWSLKWVGSSTVFQQIGEVGIIFLLFLLGLNLHPQKLFHMLHKATLVAIISSILFASVAFGVALLFKFPVHESVIIGAAIMFSSTIIGLKLLPTTILHHQHIGEVVISILLLQDLLAIIVLFTLRAGALGQVASPQVLMITSAIPILIVLGYLAERYVLKKLLTRFDRIKEYIFLLSVGWCLGMAELASAMGLSSETGAFIAGVSLAASPLAIYIVEKLKPLRDFFLVLFFFALGANFNLNYLKAIIVPALVIAGLTLLFKPLVFRILLRGVGESRKVAWEVGIRLGQASEFSLLIAYLASSAKLALISPRADYLIQAATIITFFISSYIIVLRYPTPLSLDARMHRD